MRKSKEEMDAFDFLNEIDDPDERERYRREFCLIDYNDAGHRRPRSIVGNGYHSQLNKAILGHTEEEQLVNVLGEKEAAKVVRRKETKEKGKGEARQYMDWDEAAGIYDAASFLTQEHNLFFNSFITIAYKTLLLEEAEAMTGLLTSLLDEAGSQMKRWGHDWHYLYVHENSHERGLHSHVLAYVPPELKKRFKDWCRDSHNSFFWRHCGVASKEAVDIQIKHPRTPETAAGWQWDRVQYLTKGLNPHLIARDRESGQMRSIFDLIGQRPNYRRPSGVVPFKLRAYGSKLIWYSAQDKARKEGMPMLSAFRDKAWTHLKLDTNWLGWESKEYQARIERRERYKLIQDPIAPHEADEWIDQHRYYYSDSELASVELQKQLLQVRQQLKTEAWFAENVRQWRRDWLTWWEYERALREAANATPSSMEELLKTLQI